MGKRLQDRVEELATERYGVGTALSVDRELGIWAVRIWDRKGVLVKVVISSATKDLALLKMRDHLQTESKEGAQS